MIEVKLCGFLRQVDVEAAIAAGATALGLNFVPQSKRYISPGTACELVQAFAGQVEWVGVVADLSFDELTELRREVGLDVLQLHGNESAELLERLGPQAYKAQRVASSEDVTQLARFKGRRILVDAKVGTELGGTGHTFDWELVRGVAKSRDILLAGGLHPGNVGDAVRCVRPFGVDVASGVEDSDGFKDPEKMQAFVRNARAAAGA